MNICPVDRITDERHNLFSSFVILFGGISGLNVFQIPKQTQSSGRWWYFLTPQNLDSYQILVISLKLNPMGRNTSISLGDHFENFVDDKVSTGRFKNASEVIRAGLRLLEDEETKIVSLKNAIAEGIESGAARNFNPKKHLEKLKTAKRKNG